MQRPIEVLELRSTYGYGGGPDKTILLSAARHDPAAFRVHLAYLRGEGDRKFNIGDRARAMELDYSEIRESGRFGLGTLRQLSRMIRERRIDVVHAHEYKTDVLAYLLSQRHRDVAFMSTAHGWVTKTRKLALYNRLDLWTLKRFPRVVAVSGATRGRLVEYGVPESRITLIHNAIDEQAWSRQAVGEDARGALGVPREAKLVGTITRLAGEKDLTTFLEVARRVLDVIPEAYFVIVGEGPQRDEVLADCARLNLNERVIFPGYRSDLPQVYAALDVHLITSLTEGLPNNLLEALSMSVPTVSTRVGGIGEIVEDGANGYLLEPRDVDGLTDRVLRLLQDDVEHRRIGDAGRQTIEQRFAFSLRMEKIEAVYRDLAEPRLR